MVVILNNDATHPIPISEYTHDYLSAICHLGNTNNDWDTNILNYLISIKDTPITALMIKQNDTILRSYSNLNGHIVIFNDTIALTDNNGVSNNVYIDISMTMNA